MKGSILCAVSDVIALKTPTFSFSLLAVYCQFEPLPGQISVTLLSAHLRQNQGHLLPLMRHVTSIIPPRVTGLVLEGPIRERSPSGLKGQVKEYYYSPSFNRPFPSCLKPLFQSEANCEAFDMKMVFILMQTKLIFTTKVWHFWPRFESEFLELGNGLFHCHRLKYSFVSILCKHVSLCLF